MAGTIQSTGKKERFIRAAARSINSLFGILFLTGMRRAAARLATRHSRLATSTPVTTTPSLATSHQPLATSSGVTLIEMIVVVAIIAIMAGIMFPSATSGIDSIRLASAADSTAAFLSSAVNRVERNQVMIELTVSKPQNALFVRAFPNFERRFDLPDGIVISGVFPELQNDDNLAPRHFLMFPGGSPPRVGVRIMNRRGGQRMVSLDPITGVPVIERLANGQ